MSVVKIARDSSLPQWANAVVKYSQTEWLKISKLLRHTPPTFLEGWIGVGGFTSVKGWTHICEHLVHFGPNPENFHIVPSSQLEHDLNLTDKEKKGAEFSVAYL